MEHERLVQRLQEVGLSEKAALLYEALLQRGGAYPSKLAEQTKLNRSTVYKILLELSVKGLVTEIERGKKLFYQVEKPDKLLRFSKMQSEMAQEAYERAHEFLPELEHLFAQSSYRPSVRYFENADGVTSIYEDMVAEKKPYEMLAFSHGEAFKEYLPAAALREFVKAKEKNRITTRAIVPDTLENRAYNKNVFAGLKKAVWPVIRYVPKEVFPFAAEMTLYGEHKLAITKLRGEEITGIIIEDELIHDMFKMVFELLWKSDQVSG